VTEVQAGVFVCVVGPSGVGKDTLLSEARRELAHDSDFLFVRRMVTRPTNAYEDHDSISEADFAAGVRDNTFALHWRAHGLGYAVPLAARNAVYRGTIAVCNLSRAIVAEARAAFPKVATVLVTANAEVLTARLAGRGRETREAIAARLARESGLSGSFAPDYTLANDGSREAGGERLADILRELRSHNLAVAERHAS
jgi:ribose 1,5-bisphosphokinase